MAIEDRARFALSIAFTVSIVAYPDLPPDIPPRAGIDGAFIGAPFVAFLLPVAAAAIWWIVASLGRHSPQAVPHSKTGAVAALFLSLFHLTTLVALISGQLWVGRILGGIAGVCLIATGTVVGRGALRRLSRRKSALVGVLVIGCCGIGSAAQAQGMTPGKIAGAPGIHRRHGSEADGNKATCRARPLPSFTTGGSSCCGVTVRRGSIPERRSIASRTVVSHRFGVEGLHRRRRRCNWWRRGSSTCSGIFATTARHPAPIRRDHASAPDAHDRPARAIRGRIHGLAGTAPAVVGSPSTIHARAGPPAWPLVQLLELQHCADRVAGRTTERPALRGLPGRPDLQAVEDDGNHGTTAAGAEPDQRSRARATAGPAAWSPCRTTTRKQVPPAASARRPRTWDASCWFCWGTGRWMASTSSLPNQ